MTKNRIISDIKPSANLRWTYRNETENMVYPPAVCLIDETYYQICGFDTVTENYFLTEADDLADAINKSVSVYGAKTLNTVELANIAAVCLTNSIEYDKIDAFAENNVKGRQNFEILKAVSTFDPVIKKYLSVKDIPLKTLGVFNKLKDQCKTYIINILSEKDISTGDFRKMVNLLFDMGAKADISTEGDIMRLLSDQKDETRLKFMEQFGGLTKEIPISVQSQDNFETGSLLFSFTATSADEYQNKIKAAMEKQELVEAVFRFLDEHNIS